MHMYVMPCILLKPVSKCFELDPRPLHFMLQWSTFWLEKIFEPFVSWEWAQDAITCSLYNHSFWNFHNSKFIERSAHWRHKIMTPSNIRLDLPLLQFWNFLSLYFFGRGDILQQSMLWELQKFKLQFIGIPYMYQESKNNIFFHFWHFSVFSVTTSTPVGVIYSITQKYLPNDLLYVV